MTVEELIKKLESMPQNVLVYAEGELADSVVLENCQGNIYVRIFKSWEVEFTGRCKDVKADGIEEWNGIHAQITVPKGTFDKIWNDAKEDIDETI